MSRLSGDEWDWLWRTLGRPLIPPTPPTLDDFIDKLAGAWPVWFGWSGESPWDPSPSLVRSILDMR